MSLGAPVIPTSSPPLGRHRVRKALEQMIVQGAFSFGAKLVQQDLAEQFGVSLSVVREALLELRAVGLVETIDNRGAFVSELTLQKLFDAVEVRAALEGLAVRLCCDRATREDLRSLVHMAHRIYELATHDAEEQRDEAASLDRELHQQLVHLSRNSMLIRLSDHYRVLGKILRFDRDAAEVRDEHVAFLAAIAEGRADDAERLVRQHIHHSKLALQRSAGSGHFVPQWVR